MNVKRTGMLVFALVALILSTPVIWSGGQEEKQGEMSKTPATIRFQSWRFADITSGDLYRKWMKEYEQLNPHVSIQTEAVPFAQRIEKFTTQVLAGAPPDIAGVGTAEVVQFGAQGQVENLDKFYAQEGSAFKKSFTEGALALSEHQGSLFALSHEIVTSEGIWCNLEHLKEIGITPSEAVASWSKFQDAMKKATTKDRYGLAMRGKDVTGLLTRFWPYIMQKAGPMISEEDIRTKLASPGAKEVFKAYAELYTVHKVTPNPTEIDFARETELFAQGKATFQQNGPWMLQIIEKANPEMKGKFLPQPIPVFAGGKPIVAIAGLALVIGKGSPNAAEAWKIMKFMTTKEKQLENFQLTGFLPSHKEVVDDPAIRDNPIASVYTTQMSKWGVPQPRSVKTNEIWSVITEEFHNALLQNKTPEKALEDAVKKINTEVIPG